METRREGSAVCGSRWPGAHSLAVTGKSAAALGLCFLISKTGLITQALR